MTFVIGGGAEVKYNIISNTLSTDTCNYKASITVYITHHTLLSILYFDFALPGIFYTVPGHQYFIFLF